MTTSEGAALVPTYDSAGRVTHLEGPYWSGDPAAARVELVYGYNGPLVTSEQWDRRYYREGVSHPQHLI